MRVLLLALTYFSITSSLVFAGEANVLQVKFEKSEDDYFNVYATIQHDDEGWEHYADRWEILDMEGNLLDKRVLMHPHSAAPFTRGILRARLPQDIKMIQVRAHDSVHGYGGKVVEIIVPEN